MRSSDAAVLHWIGADPVEVLTPDMPRLPYRSRAGEPKIAVHWGQRKLILSELQALTPPHGDGDLLSSTSGCTHVCYVGSAPGGHLLILDSILGKRLKWTLCDPGHFDPRLESSGRFRILNEYFDMRLAYSFVADVVAETHPALAFLYRGMIAEAAEIRRSTSPSSHLSCDIGHIDAARQTVQVPTTAEPPFDEMPVGLHTLMRVVFERRQTIFISDVRSGTPDMPNFGDHVTENMLAQRNWVRAIEPTLSLLKYRPPYPHESAKLDSYLGGIVLLPVWGAQTTTECRLLVRRGAPVVQLDAVMHEEQLFYFNSVLRERVHFNHELIGFQGHDARFDSACEAAVLRRFILHHVNRDTTPHCRVAAAEIRRLSALITRELGETLDDARRKTDALLCAPQYVSHGNKRYRVDATPRKPGQAVTLRDVLQRRQLAIFWREVSESELGEASGWCCRLVRK